MILSKHLNCWFQLKHTPSFISSQYIHTRSLIHTASLEEHKHTKMKITAALPVYYVILLSSLVIISYNVVLDRMTDIPRSEGIFSVDGMLRGTGDYYGDEEEPTWFESAVPGQNLDRVRKLDIDRYINKRVSVI